MNTIRRVFTLSKGRCAPAPTKLHFLNVLRIIESMIGVKEEDRKLLVDTHRRFSGFKYLIKLKWPLTTESNKIMNKNLLANKNLQHWTFWYRSTRGNFDLLWQPATPSPLTHIQETKTNLKHFYSLIPDRHFSALRNYIIHVLLRVTTIFFLLIYSIE